MTDSCSRQSARLRARTSQRSTSRFETSLQTRRSFLPKSFTTNPGQEGAVEANGQVGNSTDAAYFAEHAFYAARSLPSFLKIRIPARFGNPLTTGADIDHGIGSRLITNGAVTLGSPVVGSVSASLFSGLAIGQVVTTASDFPVGTTVNRGQLRRRYDHALAQTPPRPASTTSF